MRVAESIAQRSYPIRDTHHAAEEEIGVEDAIRTLEVWGGAVGV